ncbi:unnamed protein product [Symbiodinium pilosum]|uniref:Uncharacterized protein n=1 Tax=Symbiodinium pilosum TaxID=2952 RepID=A0A812IQP1_SYMPI|nr:unnamed protein product [Symbiodinium pilosum]
MSGIKVPKKWHDKYRWGKVLAIRDSQPEPLWEYVKGSYEIFANETTAKEVFEANGVRA